MFQIKNKYNKLKSKMGMGCCGAGATSTAGSVTIGQKLNKIEICYFDAYGVGL